MEHRPALRRLLLHRSDDAQLFHLSRLQKRIEEGENESRGGPKIVTFQDGFNRRTLQSCNIESMQGIAAGIYFAGFIYFAWNLNLNDRVFQSCIKKDEDYHIRIKLDPFFQNFYIINTMHYFGISERLIKKTEDELKAKVLANAGKEKRAGMVENFEKSMIALALKVGGEAKIA